MVDINEEKRKLMKDADTTNLKNIILGRESFKKNLTLIYWAIKSKMVKKLPKLLKALDADVVEILKYLKGLQKGSADFEKDFEKKLKKTLADEEEIDNLYKDLSKDINSEKHNMSYEREIVLKFIERIIKEGFDKKRTLKVSNLFNKELKMRKDDLTQIKDSWAILAGREEGAKTAEAIGAINKVTQKGTIKNKYFFTRIGERMDVRKLIKKLPHDIDNFLNKAMQAEQDGEAERVLNALIQVVNLFIQEDRAFEAVMSDYKTDLTKYVIANRKILLDLTKAYNKKKGLLSDSYRKLLAEYIAKFASHNGKFSKDVRFFRRGNETALQKSIAMINELEMMIVRIPRENSMAA